MTYSQPATAGSLSTGKTSPPQAPVQAGFEYTGKTALTVRGTVTGTQYRFHHPGHRQWIDHRDIPGIQAIPILRRLK